MSTEINSYEDYRSIERLGLLPTDRDPSSWLRMTARVFAAYKEVDLDKTVVAYISGFWITNKDTLSDGSYWKFEIQRGTAFVDDQFIGFADDLVLRFPKNKYLPGNDYWLVLYYKWSYETNYNLGEIKTIAPEEYDESQMLRIATFTISPSGNLLLNPQDLDEQYADNFKKLFEIAADKIIDSLELVKYHYEVFDATEKKIDPSVKSGDFVYLDYITGTYFPARACTKRFDKAVGIYMKNGSNNRDYIIYNGIIDFSEPQWNIDPDRIYLKNLEPGTSYYLLDGCTDDDVVDTVKERGKIGTYFYPGTVRVGYALDRTKLFVRLDYTSELNMQNFVEVFGDSERFMQRYQDFYEYYTKQAEFQYIIANEGSFLASFEDVENSKSSLNNLKITTQSVLGSNKAQTQTALDNCVYASGTDLNNKQESLQRYMNQYYDASSLIVNDNLLNTFKNLFLDLKSKTDVLYNDILSAKSKLSDAKFSTLNSQIQNFENDVLNIRDTFNDLVTVFDGGNLTKIIVSSQDSLFTMLSDYYSGTITANTLKSNLDNLILSDPKGVLIRAIELIETLVNQGESFTYSYQVAAKDLSLFYKNSDITITLPSTTFTKYTLSSTTCKAIPDSSSLTVAAITKTGPDASEYVVADYDDIQRNILNYYIDSLNYANSSIHSIKLLINRIQDFRNQIDQIETMKGLRDESSFIQDINTNIDSYNSKLNLFIDAKKSQDISQINLDSLQYQYNILDEYSVKFNEIIASLNANKLTVQNDISSLTNLLGEQLDAEKPMKSIFTLNNFQRIIYNYSYLTQRIKIKLNELKQVQDGIQIIQNQIEVVQSTPPINNALLTDLINLKSSYAAVEESIYFELSSMKEEFNKIRTSYLGEAAIEINDLGTFDPGPYALTDLDCLITSE